MGISERKTDHIDIGLHQDVSMSRSTGFADYHFMHQALPELALEDVSVKTNFLGFTLDAPILISSMTGGNERAETINQHLGEAAEALKIPMAVGSERIAIEHPETADTFKVARDAAPNVPIFGNIGAVQLNYGITADDLHQAIKILKADGLFLHVNPLQEAIQSEGDTNFRGLLDEIGNLANQVDFPLLVKEVGCGIAAEIAVSLADRGVAAIDVSGAGGTSWASIESKRATDPGRQRLGEVFSNWGIPTVESLQGCREALPDYPLIASGGIRNGLDVAKAIALGADLVAFAMPLLEPATRSTEAVIETIKQIIHECRVAMFLIGARDIPALKASRRLLRKM